MDKNEYYTASGAVYSALSDIQAGVERFAQFLEWALEAVTELEFDANQHIHTVEIPMKPWKQIDWPCDMVDWVMIGFRSGNQVRVFTADNKIPLLYDKVDCVPQENKPVNQLPATDIVFPFFLDGPNYMGSGNHFYGVVVDQVYDGYFKVDKRNKKFNFTSLVDGISNVYLEYITDGINPSGATFIPPYAFKCVKNYIHWQRKLHDDRYSLGERAEAKAEYTSKFGDVLERNMDLSIEDIREALWHGRTQVPKGA